VVLELVAHKFQVQELLVLVALLVAQEQVALV
jgi:hypothetical protein